MLKLATKFAPRQPAFETAHRAGFHCAEFYLNEALLADWEKIIPLAWHYPMEYVLHCPNKRELSPDTIGQLVELYRALGCRALALHQPHYERYGDELRRREPGLRLAVENHKLTIEEFDLWAAHNPGLTLDVEHLWKYTLHDVPLAELYEALRRFLTRFGDKLRHVHMPGYLPGHDEHRPMYCSREMIFGALALFAEFRFDGLIVSEVNEEYQNLADLEMDVLLFRRWREKFDPLMR